MNTYGLIGYPLDHSFSKKYFEEKFVREKIAGCDYRLWPIKSIDEFLPLIGSIRDLRGLNVTIPYKEFVIRFLDELDVVAKEVKAVNCIRIIDGKLKGYNTDITGLEISLKSFLPAAPVHAFILGTGGSSKAAVYVLKKLKIPFSIVSTRKDPNHLGYPDMVNHMKTSNLIINTTPLGTFPDMDSFPDIPYSALTSNDFLFDLVYNPEETLFLKRGKQKGAKTKNGLEMLRIQAEKSWEIWNEE